MEGVKSNSCRLSFIQSYIILSPDLSADEDNEM